MGERRLPAFIKENLDAVDRALLCGQPVLKYTKRELAAALIWMEERNKKETKYQADRRSFLFGLLKKRRSE